MLAWARAAIGAWPALSPAERVAAGEELRRSAHAAWGGTLSSLSIQRASHTHHFDCNYYYFDYGDYSWLW